MEAPGCGGPWESFSSGAVEAHPTLEYHKIECYTTCVEAPWLWRPPGCGGPWCGVPLAVEFLWLWRPSPKADLEAAKAI